MEILLSELSLFNNKLSDLQFKNITDYIRIYVNPHDYKDNGFDFMVVNWMSCSSENNLWKDCTVEILMYGSAFFDGVRHIWFDNEELNLEPYWHYISPVDCIKIFQEIHNLEKEFCSDYEK